MKNLLLILAALFFVNLTSAQINAKLMRYMDVSDSQIVFVYGGDIWVVDKNGGTALSVTSSPGEESWPRFSPDGKSIAFTAQYNGNSDVFVMPVTGGVPTRVTFNAFPDRLIDWHPDGKKLLFASSREMGARGLSEFFMVEKDGGFPEKLPVPYGELASFSPDGKKLAYITKITENYPFKRYRGGLTSDIIIYDFEKQATERITENKANDGKPVWAGNKIYFLSDRDENMRLNIWEYDTNSKAKKQVTFFEDFDISFISGGPEEIVFEMGGDLYLMDIASQNYRKTDINVVSDLSVEMPQSKDVSKNIANVTASPGGKRIVFEARGELFNVPAEEGFTWNMTQSSGAFDQSPAWSPNGKTVAYWSDKSGEYELYLQDSEGKEEARKLTNRKKGFGYTPYWSPNSKKIAFIDETNTIFIIDIESADVTEAGNTRWNIGHGARYGYPITWSHDSKWITFTKGLDNSNGAIFVFNTEKEESHQVTSGFYDDSFPVFSTDGKYLFYLTKRNMDAAYSSLGDGTWIYPNSTQIAAISLTKDAPSLLAAKNDEVEIKE
ncbi:MAG: S41 family peptidase, partial [Tangfeifania sp.]